MGEVNTAAADFCASRAACSHRDLDDDFFCLRYQVWYPSIDCAYRTLFRTCDGCGDCDQGRFNLKRHRSALDQRQRIAFVD
jgi:hypothetical protein